MFRHIVMFRWADSVTDDTKREVIGRLWGLPEQVPQVRSFHVGADAGLDSRNFDVAVVAEFDDVGDYESYARHPDHVALVADWLGPNITDRAAVQFSNGEVGP